MYFACCRTFVILQIRTQLLALHLYRFHMEMLGHKQNKQNSLNTQWFSKRSTFLVIILESTLQPKQNSKQIETKRLNPQAMYLLHSSFQQVFETRKMKFSIFLCCTLVDEMCQKGKVHFLQVHADLSNPFTVDNILCDDLNFQHFQFVQIQKQIIQKIFLPKNIFWLMFNEEAFQQYGWLVVI